MLGSISTLLSNELTWIGCIRLLKKSFLGNIDMCEESITSYNNQISKTFTCIHPALTRNQIRVTF